MQCRDFRELADSYLSDELLIETNHDVMRHLESCADCRDELAARRELRDKLREGFQHAPELQVSDEFASALKAQLREVALNRSSLLTTRRVPFIAIAASLVIAAAFGFRLVQQRWREQNPPFINSNVNAKASSERNDDRSAVLSAALGQSAVGDHRDCALNHRLDEKPIPLDQAGRSYDPPISILSVR
jgi:anti-sigma factor RsiW